MADLVWVYKGESLPHVHGRRNHIDNTILLTPSRGQAAKTWQLSTTRYMTNQFAQTSNLPKGMMKMIQKVTNPQLLEEIELGIQEAFVQDTNRKFSLVSNASSLETALTELKTTMTEGQTADGKKFVQTFDQLLTLIDENASSIQLWGSLANDPGEGAILEPQEVNAIIQLKQMMAQYIPLLGADGSLNVPKELAVALFNVISGTVTENYYTGIQQIDKQVEFEIREAFKAVKGIALDQAGINDVVMTGAKGVKVNSTDPITNQKVEKSANSLVKKHIKVSVPGYGTYAFDITIPASMKYYIRKKNSWVHLSQYSGKNSILMDSLRDMYGSNWSDQTAYAIYNALAFSWSPKYKNDAAEKNYRIIRHDLILRTAYTYLAGSQKTLEDRIFLYNGHAYSILAILKAIFDKELNRENIFDRSTKDKYFDIYISHGGDANKWIPAPGEQGQSSNTFTPNKAAATERIHNVLNACDRIKTRGMLKTSVLTEAILKQYIPMVPSVKVDLT